MADSLPDRRLRNRAGMASGTLLYKQEPPRGADPGAVGERRGIKAKNHIFTRRALQQIQCVLLNLKWLMDENVFLDKPSEIIPGKTVKGWMVDQVLQDYMQGLGDFEGRHEFSESI